MRTLILIGALALAACATSKPKECKEPRWDVARFDECAKDGNK